MSAIEDPWNFTVGYFTGNGLGWQNGGIDDGRQNRALRVILFQYFSSNTFFLWPNLYFIIIIALIALHTCKI
ncbi:hypothetical protein BDE36_1090 [Arcticibacter tournemirensis]|nr:hypothetical protein BDE36_1090 [Arcticibacter tournemirensis]